MVCLILLDWRVAPTGRRKSKIPGEGLGEVKGVAWRGVRKKIQRVRRRLVNIDIVMECISFVVKDRR